MSGMRGGILLFTIRKYGKPGFFSCFRFGRVLDYFLLRISMNYSYPVCIGAHLLLRLLYVLFFFPFWFIPLNSWDADFKWIYGFCLFVICYLCVYVCSRGYVHDKTSWRMQRISRISERQTINPLLCVRRIGILTESGATPFKVSFEPGFEYLLYVAHSNKKLFFFAHCFFFFFFFTCSMSECITINQCGDKYFVFNVQGNNI